MSDAARSAPPALLVAAVLTYALLVAGQVLLGLLAAVQVGLLAWVVGRLSVAGFVAQTGRLRLAGAGALALLALGYSVVVTAQVLLGLMLATLLVLVAWVTAPRGPLARAVAWVRAAREDLRRVREAVETDRPAPDD